MNSWLLSVLATSAILCSGCGKGREALAKVLKAKSAASGETASAPAGGAVTELAAAEVESFTRTAGSVAVLDFHAPWCGPCRELGPILEKVASGSGGKVRLGKVNVDKARELAGKMGVQGIPDVRIYRDGKEVDRFVGMLDEASVRRKIEAHTAGLPPAANGSAAASTPPPAPAGPEPGSKDWLPPGMTRR